MTNFMVWVGWNAVVATGLAVGVAVAGQWKRLRCRPAVMHVLWLLVLAKLVMPPMVQVPLPAARLVRGAVEAIERTRAVAETPAILVTGTRETRRARETAGGKTIAAASIQKSAMGFSWWMILCPISIGGTLLLLVWVGAQHLRISKILRLAQNADQGLLSLAKAMAARMGVRAVPRVCMVDAAISPLLWPGLRGPVIVLPRRLIQEMKDQQLMCILGHEMAHYLRGDHWANLFALVVNGLFWWHPMVWWARREMRAAQETCCDGLALSGGGVARRCYAQALLKAIDFVQASQPMQPALASGFGGNSSLLRRFEMITTSDVQPRFSRGAGLLAAVCAVGMLCIPSAAQVKPEAGGWSEFAKIEVERPVTIVTSDVNWLAAGDDGGNVFAWPAKTLEGQRLMMKGAADGGSNHSVDRLQITPDGRDLYAVLDNHQMMWMLHLVNTRTDRSGAGVGGTHPHYFGFSFDTDTWIERHVDHTVLVLRKNMWGPNAEPGFKSIEYDAAVTQAMISENGEKLAAVTADNKLRLYDSKTLALLHTIELPKQRVEAMHISREGAKVAVVGEGGLARIYGVAGGNEIAPLRGHEGSILTVAFSPDGKTVVTGGADKTVRLWDAGTGAAAGVLKAHEGAVNAVGYDPSGDRIYSGSADKTVRVWRKE